MSAGSKQQAHDLSECEASVLEDNAFLKLAYVSLCQNDFAAAIRYSRRLLVKNHLLSEASDHHVALKPSEEAEEFRKRWTLQSTNFPWLKDATKAKYPAAVACITSVVMYATEGLLALHKQSEALALMTGFMQGQVAPKMLEQQRNQIAEVDPSQPPVILQNKASKTKEPSDPVKSSCGGLPANTNMGGFTSPSYLYQCSNPHQAKETKGAEKEPLQPAFVPSQVTEGPCLGDTMCMLYTNWACLQMQDGKLKEAEKSCEKALQVQPKAQAPLRSLVYMLLKRGDGSQALKRLKMGRTGEKAEGKSKAEK